MAIAEDLGPVHPRDFVWVDEGVTDLDLADMSIDVAATILRETPAEVAIRRIHAYQDELSAVEASLLADRTDAGHSDRSNQRLVENTGKVSKSEAKKRSSRAKAVATNRSLGSSHGGQKLSTEQLDAIALASDRTDGAAATDQRFIEGVRAGNPDQAHSLARAFVSDHRAAQDKSQSEHDRQQGLRNARRYQTIAGTKVLQLEGPQSTIDQVWERLVADADQLYRSEGGRDLPAGEHPRTHVQRLFDAAAQLLTRGSVGGDPGGGRRGHGRPTLVATLDVRDLTPDPTAQARLAGELIGSGTIPQSVLEYLACTSDWAAHVFGAAGEVLWHGRSHRDPTPAQRRALVVRDKGCVLCGAHPNRCEAHHLVPWNAPAKGRTDIDGLALVCVDCHHRIHDTHQTLYRDPSDDTWKLRPAQPEETPPPPRRPRRRDGPPRE